MIYSRPLQTLVDRKGGYYGPVHDEQGDLGEEVGILGDRDTDDDRVQRVRWFFFFLYTFIHFLKDRCAIQNLYFGLILYSLNDKLIIRSVF